MSCKLIAIKIGLTLGKCKIHLPLSNRMERETEFITSQGENFPQNQNEYCLSVSEIVLLSYAHDVGGWPGNHT